APAALRQQVLDRQADLGIGLDGDADRVVIIDAGGRLYDGDQLLYAIAKHRASKGKVSGVAGTLMTNLAFENAMQRLGIPFGRAAVGDRYVLEMMRETRASLAELTADLVMFPQVLVNVKVPRGFRWEKHQEILTAQADAERSLNGRG